MSSLPPETGEDAIDPAVARAERRLAVLQRLTEIGMELVEALRDRVIEGGTDEAEGRAEGNAGDTADAFAKLSRAVRLTLALEDRIERSLNEAANALRQDVAGAEPYPGRDPWAVAADQEEKADAFDLILAVAETEGESLSDFDSLLDAIAETPERMAAAAGGHQPLRPKIERLCRDLGLKPELSRRVGEGWEAGYLACRPRWNPFSRAQSWLIPADPPRPPGPRLE